MKRTLTQLATVLIALVVIAPGAMALVSGSASAQPTPISSCTTITEPGEYVLTQDVTRADESGDACIEIRSSNVVLHGNGRTIDGNGYGTGIGTSGTTQLRNVSIVNLTFRENVYNVRLDRVTDGRLTNVTSRSPDPVGAGIAVSQSERIEIRDSDLDAGANAGAAVQLRDSAAVTIANNTFTTGNHAIDAKRTNRSTVSGNYFTDVSYAIDFESGSGNVISNNTVEGRPRVGIGVGGRNNTVVGNTITLAYNGIRISGFEHTIAKNDVSRIEEWAVSAQGRNHTFVNNEFSGGEGASRSGGALRLAGADHEVAANTLSGVHGVYIRSAEGSVEVHHNHVRGNYQIRVAKTELCTAGPAGAAAVDVHANTFTADEFGENYGVLNEDDEVLNATNNYWGADSGPSSSDGNVSDPITGTVADGSGASVSAGVHFDPWLRHQPSNRTGA